MSAQARQSVSVVMRSFDKRSTNSDLSSSSRKMSRFSMPRTITCWRRPRISIRAVLGITATYGREPTKSTNLTTPCVSLVDETGKQAEIKDKAMLNRVVEIEHLDQEDKNTVLRVIDSLLRDAKAKKAYA